MSRASLMRPYRVLDHHMLRLAPVWTVRVDDGAEQELDDDDVLSAWDAQSTLHFSRSVEVVADITQHLRLKDPDDDALRLIVSFATAGGVTREVGFTASLARQEGTTCVVSFSIEGRRLAHDLTLRIVVCLGASAQSDDPLAPHLEGSILWEDTSRLQLEGGASRLSIYEVGFKHQFPTKQIDSAEFHVEITDDPELSAEHGLSVYVNDALPEFVKEVNTAGSVAERRLHSGIFRRVLGAIILRKSFPEAEYEEGTLAATVHSWMQKIWPGRSVAEIHDIVSNDFASFEARVDSLVTETLGHHRRESAL